MSISLRDGLASEVRQAAARSGIGLSTWFAQAAAAKLRSEALREFLNDYEQEHGDLTQQELSQAGDELKLPPLPTAS